MREKVDGIDNREKFRLRFYNDDPTFIRLEKKSKIGKLCYKISAEISYAECEEILLGNYNSLSKSANPLFLDLYSKIYYEQLRPKSIVDYRRAAYIYHAGNVRVTLDSDIRSGTNVAQFLSNTMTTIPLPETFILEVKYDHYLPAFIQDVVALNSRQPTAFSKYAVTRII